MEMRQCVNVVLRFVVIFGNKGWEVCGGTGGPPATAYLPTFVAEDDQEPKHDADILPHLHSKSEMNRLFRVLSAPPAGVNVEDWKAKEDHDLGEMCGR